MNRCAKCGRFASEDHVCTLGSATIPDGNAELETFPLADGGTLYRLGDVEVEHDADGDVVVLVNGPKPKAFQLAQAVSLTAEKLRPEPKDVSSAGQSPVRRRWPWRKRR